MGTLYPTMRFSLFLLFGLCGLVFASSEKCPLGATASDDGQRCFHLLPFKADFVLAEQTCRLFGGHLVSIPDPSDNRLVHYLLATQTYFDPSISQLWIGGSKLENLEAWKWSSGAAFNFSNGFVDHTTSMLGFNCLSLKSEGAEPIWVPTRCCDQQAFVCETKTTGEDARPDPKCVVCPTALTPTDAAPTTTEAPASTVNPINLLCKLGWTYNEQTRFCYKAFLDQKMSDMEAGNLCFHEGGLLPSIHSAEENSFVASFVKAAAPSETRVLLGDAVSKTGGWRDGTVFNYTNWAPNINITKTISIMMVIGESNLWQSVESGYATYDTIVCKSYVETRYNSCKTGWTKFGDFHYCAIPKQKWYAGKAICEKEGSELTSIHSEEENAFVSSLAEAGAFSKVIWLGGSYPPMETPRKIYWVDDTLDDFSKWSSYMNLQRSNGMFHMSGLEGAWDSFKEPADELTIVCKKRID